MSKAWEVNFDGLIGPSHNYGGLSQGNLASASNKGLVSRPKEAAIQGLQKMRLLIRAGLKQAVLPPLSRPDLSLLNSVGFEGNIEDIVVRSGEDLPHVLKAAYSASSMWAANAATVSPSADTQDGVLHLTVANLSTMFHRSIEHRQTLLTLRKILMPNFDLEESSRKVFNTHVSPALPSHQDFSDEGAANHVRLCAEHGGPGVELFVYGRTEADAASRFPARQSRLASECIARAHKLEAGRTVFAKQSRKAIDAGAFHNDVVCVGSLNTLFFHEFAFEDAEKTLTDLRSAADGLFELNPIIVPDVEVPLADAISSYLFNSQLLEWPGEDRLVLLAPTETRDTPSTAAYCQQLVKSNGPIGRVQYVDVRQSMQNGGGPACLRLRVVMTDDEIAAAHPGVFMDEEKLDALERVVSRYYRDELVPADLADPMFARECSKARAAILAELDLESLA